VRTEIAAGEKWMKDITAPGLDRALRLFIYDHGLRSASANAMEPVFEYLGIQDNLVAQDRVKVRKVFQYPQHPCYRLSLDAQVFKDGLHGVRTGASQSMVVYKQS
jgi:hypothetical protein